MVRKSMIHEMSRNHRRNAEEAQRVSNEAQKKPLTLAALMLGFVTANEHSQDGQF